MSSADPTDATRGSTYPIASDLSEPGHRLPLVTVPTVTGSVTMTVPPGSDSGSKLRLRGKGMPATGTLPAGDAYATLRIVLGPADPGLAAFLRDRADKPDWNPRAGLEAAT